MILTSYSAQELIVFIEKMISGIESHGDKLL